MMNTQYTRRNFVKCAAAASAGTAMGWPAMAWAAGELLPPHEVTLISGTPRERGRSYGEQFKDAIGQMLERELYAAFQDRPNTKQAMLRYAAACAESIRGYSPTVMDELEGMTEGSGLRLEEHVLITLHEELWHRGVLPSIPHCTALAAGPPDTADGRTFVAQTWDWLKSLYGLSTMLHWQRPEGPDVFAYAYPGMWTGAGINSEGIALCWTSGSSEGVAGPRVGIPSYVLIAQILYQPTLEDVVEEARRARHAGLFTFVLGDANGRLVNLEGSPTGELAVEWHEGHLARSQFGSRQMTKTPEGQPIPYIKRCRRLYDLAGKNRGQIDVPKIKGYFDLGRGIANSGTIDAMIFDCSQREVHLTRADGAARAWKRFRFPA